ncbi:MAG: threonine aldolase family protein [Bacteroidota bacterium]
MANIIDLRSDTVTKPSAAMKERMFAAELGDDVFQEDPTVNELQQLAADLFGMEDALFCSSGTQTNQIAIGVHCTPGDELICSNMAHIYVYEGGGIALNSGVSVRLIPGDRGRFTAEDVRHNINNKHDIHLPLTRLVCIEDTMNKGGGAIWDIQEISKLAQVCKQNGLAFHCDGARLFNALIESGVSAKEYGSYFDSISICLSKGLGAPVGSLLLGSKAFIEKARRRRKSLGGGMRQAGMIAAAGIYALQVERLRLAEDHQRAKEIEQLLLHLKLAQVTMPAETNILIWKPKGGESSPVVELLKANGILCFPFGNEWIRFVFHRDITNEQFQDLKKRLEAITF